MMNELERAVMWIKDEIEECNDDNGWVECDCLQYPCCKVLAERLLKSIDNSN